MPLCLMFVYCSDVQLLQLGDRTPKFLLAQSSLPHMSRLFNTEPEDIIYADMFETARRLAIELRADGADIVLAVTHNRMANDYELVQRVPEIDALLGGHDHHYESVFKNDRLVVNSGTDFQYFSVITCTIPPKGSSERPKIECEKITVTK